MTEKELIGKIKELRQIKPRENWVLTTKHNILGEEPSFSFFYYFKPAFVGFAAILIMAGIFGFSQNALPGDLFYVFKRAMEKSQAVFVSNNDKPAFQLKLANQRLEELTKAPAKNLAPTLDAFQANVSEAAKSIAKIDAATTSPIAIRQIVDGTKKIEANKQKAEAMGVVIGDETTSELNDALKKVDQNLIDDLEKRTLSDEKTKILEQIKELFDNGKYSESLELYLVNQ